MYAFASTGPKKVRVAVVGGDHSFENKALSPREAEAFRNRNLQAVSLLGASFVSEASALPR
jgi:hypothetical protein